MATSESIAAIATPQGSGGVGVIRVSGPACLAIAGSVCKLPAPTPRLATLVDFLGSQNEVIDNGLALFFPSPNSYTGEDVLELQAHGGAVVLDMLLQRVLSLGTRMARPGEFTERAFLNNKLDLSQAEAVSDLISSGSQAAARAAIKSLQGEFSAQVNELTEELTALRIYMEAALDFPEEEIDFLASDEMSNRATNLRNSFKKLLATTEQGRLLRDGLTVVIAGKPNAGKSSLLNKLTGEDTAIVTDIKGTTRDLLHERIQIDGLPVHLIDTAGLHASDDEVEKEGIRRAIAAIRDADRVLWIEDLSELDLDETPGGNRFSESPGKLSALIAEGMVSHMASQLAGQLHEVLQQQSIAVDVVLNKSDLVASELLDKIPDELSQPQQKPLADTHQLVTGPGQKEKQAGVLNFGQCIKLSAATGEGLDVLRAHLKSQAGYDAGNDNVFIARRRHIVALQAAAESLEQGLVQLENYHSPELAAEDFRLAQRSLGEITGEVSSDDLLGRIFAGFCIGK